ncbi:hypothetical protein V5F77_21605 [Xanthobacter sp. DSM 24535]|uniref:hypothetical protein n=1 Tax=Roseixanthobacter psychrophilus TaxID=3119917 RepID=UPI00372B8EBE
MNGLRVLVALAVLVPSISAVALTVGRGALAGEAGHAQETSSPPLPQDAANLVPLSEDDERSSQQSGCMFLFSVSPKDYVQLIDGELMFRTLSGLHVCHIANADAFMDARESAVCDGISLKLRRTGRITHNPASDSSTGPAQLLIGQGGVSRTLRGTWGVAC